MSNERHYFTGGRVYPNECQTDGCGKPFEHSIHIERPAVGERYSSKPITADAIAAALKEALAAYDADIGWRAGSGYDHGDPPTADQIAKGMAARLSR